MFRTIGLAFILWTSLGTANAEPDCNAPLTPQIPAVISSAEEAQNYSLSVFQYIEDGTAAQKCFSEYIENNETNLTEDERQEIKNTMNELSAEMRQVSLKWNSVYGEFLERTRASE